MKTVHQVLVDARARLTNPDNWIKGAFALDAKGRRVGTVSPEACKWCAAGAIVCELGGSTLGKKDDLMTQAFRELRAHLPSKRLLRFDDIADFNDNWRTQHADVLAVFDKAIEATKGTA